MSGFGLFDTDIRIAQAIDGALRSFEEHGFNRPTTMVIGEDVQRALLATGAVPDFTGRWGTIMGVEITGVSEKIGALLLQHQTFHFNPFTNKP
jgi:hypothetical protein